MKRAVLPVLLALATALCLAAPTPVPEARHAALQAMGPQAGHIVDLWRLFIAICCIVFGLILAVLLLVLWRTPRASEQTPADLSSMTDPETRPRRRVVAAVAGSTLLLLVLVVASVFTDRALARLSLHDALNLEVTSTQWWWSARYIDGSPSDLLETANEIHIPVGRPVVLQLHSSDVIHSLWLPNLAGKRDLIPGRSSTLTLRADQPGIYRGQCAEFCGYQHALMGLLVVAEPPEQFQAWLQAQRQPAAPPADPLARRGQALFESLSCAMCHSVQGTQARGKHAPDLTHLASRQTLAAGTLPNTPQQLAAWIADPQKFKPGVNMPATPMSPEDLQAIVAFLGGLK